MSRTDKDRPWRLGGQRHKYATSEKHHGWFTRDIRRRVRGIAKASMRTGREPEPHYPLEHNYYD